MQWADWATGVWCCQYVAWFWHSSTVQFFKKGLDIVVPTVQSLIANSQLDKVVSQERGYLDQEEIFKDTCMTVLCNS